jgi:glutaminase
VKLIRKHDPNIAFKLPNNDMGVLLCQAAFGNNLADLKRLVLNGVDPNESDYDGRTAMHLAACEGHIEILEYLIEIRANIMCRDRFGGTPLEDAVRHNFDLRNAGQVQKLLRDHGATLSGEGLDYVQKMCSYAAEGKVENIRLLTENHIDVSLG